MRPCLVPDRLGPPSPSSPTRPPLYFSTSILTPALVIRPLSSGVAITISTVFFVVLFLVRASFSPQFTINSHRLCVFLPYR